MKRNELSVRTRIFVTLLALCSLVYITFDYCDLADECLVMYCLEFTAALMNGCLYLWWWAKHRRASVVYVWITVLFFASSFRIACSIYSRLQLIQANIDVSNFISILALRSNYLWTLRSVPELLVMLYMLALVLARLWCNIPEHECYEHNNHKRNHD